MTIRSVLAVLVVIGVGVAGWWAFTRFEGGAPEIAGAPEGDLVVGAGGRELELGLRDAASGVREITAVLSHARGEVALLEESYPGAPWSGAADRGERRVVLRIDPKAAKLPEGGAILRVAVRDWSLRGNESVLEIPVAIDRKPPQVSVASGLTYVKRGGAGSVVYSVSEPPAESGVQVGEAFFRGYPVGGTWVAIFAVPAEGEPEPRVRVVAVDAAGNRAEASWPAVVQEQGFPKADVNLPETFLDNVVRGLAEAHDVSAADPSEAFREINTRVRTENERRIRELVADSAPEALWQGPFQQLPNSQVTSRFAERRDYVVGGVVNSQATHYGYDLASTAAAPITATAAGRVLFAGELGIYGNCVVLDHGLGVSSLYGHLSRIDVQAGASVEQGQALGLSGATGLAGGDHLHFAILVGGTYVDPLEWWDPGWVETHLDSRIHARVAAEDRSPGG